jgi:hypothetical protein
MKVSGRPQVPVTLPPGTQIPGPTELEAGWANSRYGRLEKRKISFCSAAIRTPNRAARSLVTTLTTLSRLLGCMWKNLIFVDPFFTPLLHLTYMQGLPVLLRHSFKTWDKTPSIRDLCTGSGRKVSLPLQLVFPSYPLIKMAVRDLEMF